MQIGHSKVFVRRQVFEGLEFLRNKRLGKSAIVIQKHARRFVAQIQYFESYFALVILQSFVRMVLSKKTASLIREDLAAVKIHCAWRRSVATRYITSARVIARFCQSSQRGAVARQLYGILRLDVRACILQRCWRRYKYQKEYQNRRSHVVAIQCFVRQYQAKAMYKQLRLEARDLNNVLAERDRFRQEMVKLRREVEVLKQESSPSAPRSEEAFQLQRHDAASPNDAEVEKLRAEVSRLQAALARQNEILNPGGNSGPPESVFVRKMPNWSLFGGKKDDAASHSSSLGNGVTPNGNPQHSHPISPNKGLDFDSPKHKTETLLAVTPVSWPSAITPGKSSPSASLLDAERHIEVADYQMQEIGNGGGPPSPTAYLTTTMMPARSTFEEDPMPVEERRGMEFTQELHWLHQAILDNNHLRVDETLQHSKEPHVLVNEIGEDGRAALHKAVEARDLKSAKILIENGAFVNAQDIAGDTALHLCNDSRMIALLLVDGKANPNIPNIDGISALHSAVQRMDANSVRLLLKHHAKIDVADNLRWLTPLHLAALPTPEIPKSSTNARGLVVDLLCSADAADLNYQDSEGNTPLHYAVQIESQEAASVINTLLEKGANPRISNSREQGPLLLLCLNSALREHEIFQECLQTMLFHGANPNQASRTGATPLHLCLYNKDIDGAVQLVSRAAELNLTWRKVCTESRDYLVSILTVQIAD